MHLLLFEWNGLMQKDLEEVLTDLHISFYRFSYNLSNIHEDDFFAARFSRHLEKHPYDAVFSFDYFPLVAVICHKHNLPYIAWCYDSPNRIIPYDSFALPTNYIFMFDKKEAEEYRNMGFENIFHLPLAVNVKRMKRFVEANHNAEYSCDISFVGNFHRNNLLDFVAPLPAYYRGLISAFAAAQPMLRNYYLPDDFFTDEFLQTLRPFYAKHHTTVSKEDLSFLFGKYISENDRIKYLNALSGHFLVHLYSNECPKQLSYVQYKGTANYYTKMSQVFATSKINFNSSLYNIRTGISLRILDILAAGGFLLTNYQEELFDYYEADNDFVFYTSVDDAVEKAAFYLEQEELRKKIALSGMLHTWEQFSYEKQLAKIFEKVPRLAPL